MCAKYVMDRFSRDRPNRQYDGFDYEEESRFADMLGRDMEEDSVSEDLHNHPKTSSVPPVHEKVVSEKSERQRE